MISTRQMAEATGGHAVGPRGREPAFGKARSAIAATLARVACLLEPTRDRTPHAPSVRLDPAVRRRVAESLAGELSDMLEDAARREITDGGARALLLTADIVRWLREGEELPGEGAIELLEVHVAIFNGAPHEDEKQSQRDLVAVLLALVDTRAQEIHGGRWRHRNVNVETAEARERLEFGENLDRLRRSRGLAIGELAVKAELEVLRIVALIQAVDSAGSSEIMLLARALDVEPGALLPAPPGVGGPAVDVAAAGDGTGGGGSDG